MAGVTDINYTRLLRWLLPVRLRKEKLMAWIRVITYPVWAVLYPKFKGWELKCWYDLKYQTGTVAHLERVMNDRFDVSLKRIYIDEGIYTEPLYIYTEAETQPVFIYTAAEASPEYIHTVVENLYGEADFTVHIPYLLLAEHEEIAFKAVLNRFKRDGKTYKIIYF